MSKHVFPGIPSDFIKLMLTLFLFACQKQVIQKNSSDEYARQVTNSVALKPGVFDKWSYMVNNVRTLAGTNFGGFADGPSNMARFNSPLGLAQDAAGNIYIADEFNNRIRKMTPDGTVTTLAGISFGGYKDGPGATAQFEYPTGVAVDSRGYIYVADQGNNRIRQITPDGVVSTLAGTGASGFSDGPGNVARFKAPTGIAVDPAGLVYVADQGNNRIRRISTAGIVTQWVGDGIAGFKDAAGAYAELNGPTGLAIGPKGEVYVADGGNNRVRKIVSGVISTLAQVNTPCNLAVDGAGNILVTDVADGAVREVTPAGVVRTLFGNGGRGIADGWDPAGNMYSPAGIIINAAGEVVITDDGLVRKLTAGRGVGTFLGGVKGNQDGVGVNARIFAPYGMVFDAAGNMYVSDLMNYNIRKVTPAGVSTILAGSDQFDDTWPQTNSAGKPKIAAPSGVTSPRDGTGTGARFGSVLGMTIGPSGNIYAVDGTYRQIRKITPAGVTTTIAGSGANKQIDGPGLTASFSGPSSIAMDASGNLYISDYGSIRKIDANGVVSTFAKIPKVSDTVTRYLQGITFGEGGNLYVTASYSIDKYKPYNSEIWKITPSGNAGIFAQVPANYAAYGLAYDANTHHLYVTIFGCDDASAPVYTYHSQVLQLDALGQLSYVAGNEYGFADGEASNAKFEEPVGITIGPDNIIYVADTYNFRIRMIGK